MPRSASEDFVAEINADNAFRTEMMEKEEIAERIVMEILRSLLEEMRHILQELMKESNENGSDDHSSADSASSATKNSSTKTAGMACPAKKIEQRYRM